MEEDAEPPWTPEERAAIIAEIARKFPGRHFHPVQRGNLASMWECVTDVARDASDMKPLAEEYLLMPAIVDANVVIHVLPEGQKAYPLSKLLLAVDLAERTGPREEARAAELLRGVAEARHVRN